jgi:hypothetical protein
MGAVTLLPDDPVLRHRFVEASNRGDYESALHMAGRRYGPLFLSGWFAADHLSRDELRSLILPAWTMAEWPVRAIGEKAWLAMFKAAGFVSTDGSPPPTEPLTVWRGDTKPRGMSWTLEREVADFHARRYNLMGFPAVVYEATVPPRAVLGTDLEPEGRGEREVIVNPNMLRGAALPFCCRKSVQP